MIKKLAGIYILLFVIINHSYGQTAGWIHYSTPEKNFSALFPTAPELSEDTVSLPTGVQTMHYYSVNDTNGTSYIISSIFIKESNVGDTKKYLEASRDGAVNGAKGEDVKTLKVSVGKTSYIDFGFKAENYYYKMRIYLHDAMQYSVMVYYPLDKPAPGGINQFFSSFKLLK